MSSDPNQFSFSLDPQDYPAPSAGGVAPLLTPMGGQLLMRAPENLARQYESFQQNFPGIARSLRNIPALPLPSWLSFGPWQGPHAFGGLGSQGTAPSARAPSAAPVVPPVPTGRPPQIDPAILAESQAQLQKYEQARAPAPPVEAPPNPLADAITKEANKGFGPLDLVGPPKPAPFVGPPKPAPFVGPPRPDDSAQVPAPAPFVGPPRPDDSAQVPAPITAPPVGGGGGGGGGLGFDPARLQAPPAAPPSDANQPLPAAKPPPSVPASPLAPGELERNQYLGFLDKELAGKMPPGFIQGGGAGPSAQELAGKTPEQLQEMAKDRAVALGGDPDAIRQRAQENVRRKSAEIQQRVESLQPPVGGGFAGRGGGGLGFDPARMQAPPAAPPSDANQPLPAAKPPPFTPVNPPTADELARNKLQDMINEKLGGKLPPDIKRGFELHMPPGTDLSKLTPEEMERVAEEQAESLRRGEEFGPPLPGGAAGGGQPGGAEDVGKFGWFGVPNVLRPPGGAGRPPLMVGGRPISGPISVQDLMVLIALMQLGRTPPPRIVPFRYGRGSILSDRLGNPIL